MLCPSRHCANGEKYKGGEPTGQADQRNTMVHDVPFIRIDRPIEYDSVPGTGSS